MEKKIKIEHNWRGDYSITYDGKYINLWGIDKNQPINQVINHSGKDEYEPVFLSCEFEIRNASPKIVKVDEKYVYIETHFDVSY